MNTLYLCNRLLIIMITTFSLVACSAMTGRETAGEYLDDATITAQVKSAIVEDPDLNSFQISVETFKNAVQLSGFVDTPYQIARAGDIARRTKGVQAVKNNLTIRR